VPPEILTCPLQVTFEGEEGVDQGGLLKEFFQLILPLMYQRYFEPLSSEIGDWLWFSQPSPERIRAYSLAGLLLGLAVHNSVLVEPLFPSYVMWGEQTHSHTLTHIH
jgi:hypothetical protein